MALVTVCARIIAGKAATAAVAVFKKSRRSESACGGFMSSRMYFSERCEAALGCFHRRQRAALLLNQVKLDSACLLRSLKDLLPRGHALAEEHAVALVWVGRPLLH